MEYKKVPGDTEMQTFDPVLDYKPTPKPFDDRDDRKDRRNKAKEKRISVALVIFTFLSSAFVLFGTLFPELSRGEMDMTIFRNIILATGKVQPHLIKDKITLVNLGLWRYCYDDQLYDLIELVNPYYRSTTINKRDTEAAEEFASREKRQIAREGDPSIRCHPVPKPWKMPYHVEQKQEATKICLIIGCVTCILSFLISILVLITRLPILKFIHLVVTFAAVGSLAVSIGLLISMKDDAEWYFNEAMGRTIAISLREDFGLDVEGMGIVLKSANFVKMNIGFSCIFLFAGTLTIFISLFLAELSRNIVLG